MQPRFGGTIQAIWSSIGIIAQATADADVTLGVTERKLQTNIDLTNFLTYRVPKRVSALKVRFLIATDNHDVDIEIWEGTVSRPLSGLVSEDCSLKRIATLDVIAGTQDVEGSTTLHFADTINISNDKTENGIDGGSDGAGNDANQMATIHWDLKGENVICFHGFGTFDGACTVEVKGYS